MVGLAYLTQGERPPGVPRPGHRRRGGARAAGCCSGRTLVAAAGFVAVAWFLLWRNSSCYRNPFHNFNDQRAVAGRLGRRLAHDARARMGSRRPALVPAAPFDLCARPGGWSRAPGQSIGVLIYTAGPGRHSGHAGQPAADRCRRRPARGGRRRRRWRWPCAGSSTVTATGTAPRCWPSRTSAAGCCWPSRSARRGWAAWRRASCAVVVLYVPYAAHALGPRGDAGRAAAWLARPWGARCALLRSLRVKLAWFAPALAANPRTRYTVPARLGRDVGVAPRRTLPPVSATPLAHEQPLFDLGPPVPDPDARWLYLFTRRRGRDAARHRARQAASIAPRWDGPRRPIAKMLVDMADKRRRDYRDKMCGGARTSTARSRSSAGRRCFADGGRPSRS